MNEPMTGSEQNIKPVDSTTYTEEWVDGMGGTGSNDVFIRTGGRNLRPRLAYAMELADLRPGLRILDLGTGRGEAVIHCAIQKAAISAGVDYSEVSLNRAATNAEKLNLGVNRTGSQLVLARCDAKKLPFGNGTFDRVLMLDIVEHLYEWELQEVWSEVKRVLSPQGYLVIHTLPNRWSIDIGYKLVRTFFRRLPKTAPDKRDVFHINEQTPPSLYRSLRKSGLSSHVWLKDMMLRQAEWMVENGVTGEAAQQVVYEVIMKKKWSKIYNLLMASSFRLIFASDLFAIVWNGGAKPKAVRSLPSGLAEKISRIWG